MKRLAQTIVITLIACMLVSCTSATSDNQAMIEPGDKIGNFLVTTGDAENTTYSFNLNCVQQGDKEEYTCKAKTDKQINVSSGVYNENPNGNLESVWSSLKYQLFIEGRPVNLQAFGTIDTAHPHVGAMRFWNVVIIADKPGEITAHDIGTVDGKAFETTRTYTFSAP